MKTKSIILLSGGMDSLLCLALSHARQDEIYTLHFDYGQRTFVKEKQSAEKISDHYQISKAHQIIVDLKFLSKLGGSGLTDNSIHLSTTGENLSKNDVPSSYVPYRNTLMLSYALSISEVYNVENILIGAVQDDELGYPDCRKVYFEALQKVADLGGNGKNCKIETPLILLKKHEIISQLYALKAPLELTWSCYQNDLACGVCDSCRLRLQAFRELGMKDPLKYHI